MSEIMEAHRRAFRRKTCLHPKASDETCTQSIRAHTIQKAGVLESIAEEQHVTRFTVTAPHLEREGEFKIERVGVNQASTFYGFCSHHDNELFRPLDDKPFSADPEQLFLLAYRNLCQELYQKRSALDLIPFMKQADKGRELEGQMDTQAILALYETGARSGLRDIKEHKERYDEDLKRRDYDKLKSLICRFEGTSVLAAGFGKGADYDFEGNEIQDFRDVSNRIEFMSVSLLTVRGDIVLVISWREDSSDSSEQFVDNLLSKQESLIPHLVVRFVFASAENVYMTPSWWEGLSGREQGSLRQLMRANTTAPDGHQPGAYVDDGLRVVDWELTETEKVGDF